MDLNKLKKAVAPKNREADIEAYLVKAVDKRGGHAYKFTSPQRRSVPDRLCLFPVPPEHRELVAQYVKFIEVKRGGQTATDGQARELQRLVDMGFCAFVVSATAKVDISLEDMAL